MLLKYLNTITITIPLTTKQLKTKMNELKYQSTGNINELPEFP